MIELNKNKAAYNIGFAIWWLMNKCLTIVKLLNFSNKFKLDGTRNATTSQSRETLGNNYIMILLFSAAGLGSLVKALFHGLFIISGAVLLGYVFYKSGKARKIYLGIFLIVTGFYAYWLCADYQQKKEEDKQYIGKYNLTRYGDCSSCILELYPNNTFKVYNQTHTYEGGTWEFYNDGDVSFVEFNNGGQLGYNKYEYEDK